MSTPISDAVEHELGVVIQHGVADVERVWHAVTGHLPHRHYHAGDVAADPSTRQGITMSFDSIAADVRNELTNFLATAESDAGRVKALIEEKLPEIERVGSMIANDKLFQVVYGDFVPAPLRDIAAEVISKIVDAFNAQPATPPPPPAPVDPQIQTGIAQ